VEIRNSLRLGAVLAGLVGINIYVFFYKDGTALRDIFKPSSTSKAMGGRDSGLPPTLNKPPSGAASSGGAAAGPPAAAPPAGTPASGGSRAVEGKIGPSDTLGEILAREGFADEADDVIRALGKLSDPKLIRPGDDYTVTFDDEGAPESFEYRPNPVLLYRVERPEAGGPWQATRDEKPLDVKVTEAAGVIESSLYESVQKSGEASALVSLLVDIFAWDVNFYIDTHPGDQWKVMVEKQSLGGQFYKYGNVLAAEYSGKAGTFRAFYWKPPHTPTAAGRYYDERGQAVAKTFLKTPLRFVRISSKFDRKRFHPILHREKAHLGVDYAAPTGTPIWSSANGRVVEVAAKRGSGNTVVIAHAGGLTTRYYHLSRFARGLKAGQTIRQKDVIGYVGATGLATGPHLHFSVTRNGVFVDPGKLQVSREAPAPDRAAFLEAVKPRAAALRDLRPGAVARRP